MSKKQKKAGKAVVAITRRLEKVEKERRLKACNEKVRAEMKAAKQQKPEAEEKPKAEPAKEVKRTIKAAVIEAFSANPGVTNGELTAAIKAEFPQSAFNPQHASWYRMQAKSGKLTGTKVVIPPKPKATVTASSTAAN